MKWLVRGVIGIVAVIAGIGIYLMSTALDSENPVGFKGAQAHGPDRVPFMIGIWYPTEATPSRTTLLGPMLMNVAKNAPMAGERLPLIVISHGNGGGPGSHADLAMTLASAGYVVAAPMHYGDNYADNSRAGSASLYSGRNQEIIATIEQMLAKHPQIDPQRVGAFGMSGGAFSVLTSVGGQPDMRLIPNHCAQAREFICDVLEHDKSSLLKAGTGGGGGTFQTDTRIKAAVLAAPGLGFAFGKSGLDKVGVPIQLWSGDLDDKVPYASNAGLIRSALGPRAEYHAVKGAGHQSFLSPCGLIGPPAVCADADDFDRKAAHTIMNSSIVRFFDKHLKGP